MASRIQVRRDTSSNWQANNPTLSSGEIGFATDENKVKVGDGSTAWNDLPYLQADAYIDSVILGTDTTGNYVETVVAGDGISLSGQGSESASVTVENTGVLSLSGTNNEISVTASTGNITIGLPDTIFVDVQGALIGNADSATALQTPRTIALGGDLSGSAIFDGTSDISIAASVVSDAIELGADTTGDYVQSVTASGSGLSISGTGEGASVVIQNTGITSLTGTASQISVSSSNGDPTVSLPSSVVFPGTVTLNSDPTQALHAATKQYVDEVAEGLNAKPQVEVATTENITATYNNGASGVGATLTISAIATLNIDGKTSWSQYDGILIKDQTNAYENGRYVLTTVGDAETDWVLTRCGLCDTSDEIPGIYLFVVGGNTNGGTGWVAVVDNPETFVIGVDDIDFYQFSGGGTYTAGTGLSLNGTQFSNTGVLSLSGTTNEVEVSASSGNITIGLPSTINVNASTASALATGRVITISGDSSGSAIFDGSQNISINTNLSSTGISEGTYGSASAIPAITVGIDGRITSISAVGFEALPSQTGQSGKYLTTNGTTASWGTIDLSSYAPLNSPTFTGTVTVPAPSNSTDAATKQYVDDNAGVGLIDAGTATSVYGGTITIDGGGAT